MYTYIHTCIHTYIHTYIHNPHTPTPIGSGKTHTIIGPEGALELPIRARLIPKSEYGVSSRTDTRTDDHKYRTIRKKKDIKGIDTCYNSDSSDSDDSDIDISHDEQTLTNKDDVDGYTHRYIIYTYVCILTHSLTHSLIYMYIHIHTYIYRS